MTTAPRERDLGELIAIPLGIVCYAISVLYVLEYTFFSELADAATESILSTLGGFFGMLVVQAGIGLLIVFPAIVGPMLLYAKISRRISLVVVPANLVVAGLFLHGLHSRFVQSRWMLVDVFLVGHLLSNGVRMSSLVLWGWGVFALIPLAALLPEFVPWTVFDGVAILYSVSVALLVLFRRLEINQFS